MRIANTASRRPIPRTLDLLITKGPSAAAALGPTLLVPLAAPSTSYLAPFHKSGYGRPVLNVAFPPVKLTRSPNGKDQMAKSKFDMWTGLRLAALLASETVDKPMIGLPFAFEISTLRKSGTISVAADALLAPAPVPRKAPTFAVPVALFMVHVASVTDVIFPSTISALPRSRPSPPSPLRMATPDVRPLEDEVHVSSLQKRSLVGAFVSVEKHGVHHPSSATPVVKIFQVQKVAKAVVKLGRTRSPIQDVPAIPPATRALRPRLRPNNARKPSCFDGLATVLDRRFPRRTAWPVSPHAQIPYLVVPTAETATEAATVPPIPSRPPYTLNTGVMGWARTPLPALLMAAACRPRRE